MAKTFTSLQSLCEAIKQGTVEALNTTVQEQVKEKLSASARQNAILDTGGRGAGGIEDVGMMQHKVEVSGNVITLTVKDIAPPAPSVFGTPFRGGETTFAEWIEKGQWMDLKEYLTSGTKTPREARPFIEPVAQEIASNPDFIKKAIINCL